MKNNRSTQENTTAHPSRSLVQVLRPDIIVSSGIAELDHLLGGFKAGELTLSRWKQQPDRSAARSPLHQHLPDIPE